ncbi:MAG: M28 family peptidase [Novosphingobium sp.]|nr:M28 family peptidase [Novosphingobium sp.]
MKRGRRRSWSHAALLCVMVFCVAGQLDARERLDKGLEQRLRDHIEVLASDEFSGREPGTDGEALTLRYLGMQWFDIGLVSGTNDPGNEWFVPVTLVAREPAASVAQFRIGRRLVPWTEDEALMLTSGKRSLVRDAPLLFVGKADGQGLSRNELAGRIAVMLDGGKSDSDRQNALLAEGASAVLTILDGQRTLTQVAVRRQRSGYALADDTLGGDLEGFITKDAMARLLVTAGTSLKALTQEATHADFAPRVLNFTASFEATTRETTIRTHNLIARLPGKRPDSGAVLLVAHWDHFGVCAEEPAEDRICNGAVDNASGLAVLTEIARRLAQVARLDRDVYFLATTAEELGLLGAHAFADNPPLPLGKIVAAFNIDSAAIAPAGTPLAIVGRGMTGLDATIAKVADREKRVIVAGDEANEFVRRQDGWALLQHDIPAVLVTSGYGDLDRMRKFIESDYHRPGDDLNRPIELGGAAQDVAFHIALVRWFADTTRFSPAGE